MGADGYLQVLTAIDSEAGARTLAHELVDARRAACVQVLGPIQSTYRWRGAVETAEEWLCVAKTTASAYPELERAIRDRHPYEVPEITAVPIDEGLDAYLGWIDDQVAQGP